MKFFQAKRASKRKISDLLSHTKVPVLTLDERWIDLFPEYDMPPKVDELRDEVNKQLKRQGKLTQEINRLKRYKEQLQKDIVAHMDIDDSKEGRKREKRLEKNQQLILRVKEELVSLEDELLQLPHDLQKANQELMNVSTVLCYDTLENNTEELGELEEKIQTMRIEIKDMLLKKQELEQENAVIYKYLHGIFGPKAMEVLDEDSRKRKGI